MDNIIYIIIGVFIFAILIVIFVAINRFKKRFTKKEKNYYKQKWTEIQKEKDLRQALLTADKLLEKIMRRKGYKGTLGQMLKKGKKEFSDLNGVWFAHKIRNKLAHEIDFKLNAQEAKKGLQKFEKTFRDLGAI